MYRYSNYKSEKLKLEKVRSSQIKVYKKAFAKTDNFISVYEGIADYEDLKNTYVIDKLYPKNEVYAYFRIRNTKWFYIKYHTPNGYNFGYVSNTDLSYDKNYDRTYNGNIYYKFDAGKWGGITLEEREKLRFFFKNISIYNDTLEIVIYTRRNTDAEKNMLYGSIKSIARKFELYKFKKKYLNYTHTKFHHRKNIVIIKTLK
jgi:hypothetical protein